MSSFSQFPMPRGEDWVEQLRDVLRHEPPPVDEAILEAAYDACEIDTVTMFDYFEGRLTAEERLEVEAEVAASPHAQRKLTRIGAIVAQNRAAAKLGIGHASTTPSPSQSRSPEYATPFAAVSPERTPSPNPPRITHRVKLAQPRASIGTTTLPRSEECQRISADSPFEFFRSLEKHRDQLRIFHSSAPVGTLLGLRFLPPTTDEEATAKQPSHYVAMRRSSGSSSTTTLTIPPELKCGEVLLELTEIPASALTGVEASPLLLSYERAADEDPISVRPLEEPRSAWQTWADGVLQASASEIDPTIREIAELIAIS